MKTTSLMKGMQLWMWMAIVLAVMLACSMSGATSIGDNNVKCQINCDLQDYQPVCGTDDAGETKTFNNLCILKIENCLRTTTFQKTGDGVCP